MDWYWGVLILIGVVVIATIKLKVFGMILESRKKRQLERIEEE